MAAEAAQAGLTFVQQLILAGITVLGLGTAAGIASFPYDKRSKVEKELDKQRAKELKKQGPEAVDRAKYQDKQRQFDALNADISSGKRNFKDKNVSKLHEKLQKDLDKYVNKYGALPLNQQDNIANGQAAQQVQNATNAPRGPEGDIWNGYRPYADQVPLLSPQQQASQNALLPSVTQDLLNNNGSFEPIYQNALTRYNESTEPALANRLNFAGIEGPQFANALASGRRGLQSDLAAQEQDWLGRRRDQQQNLYSTLQNRNFEPLYYPGQAGIKSQLLEKATDYAVEHGIPAIINRGENLVKSGFDYFNQSKTNQDTSKTTSTPSTAKTIQEVKAIAQRSILARNQAAKAQQQTQTSNNVLGGNPKKVLSPQDQFNTALNNSGYATRNNF